MSDAQKAVFLSYASQDAEAALRLCSGLRAVGIEVWFDQNQLVGGDAWDQKIRRQIKDCALFVPVISAATQARTEGYFRLEWRLADQRTHLMAKGRPFLLPVVIDGTRDADAHVPDSFTEVQWTRLPGGETTTAFCARVSRLLQGSDVGPVADRVPGRRPGLQPKPSSSRHWLIPAVGGLAMIAALALWQPWKKPPPSEAKSAAPMTEARKLILQARALIDDDWLAGRENFRLAEELCQRAVTLAPDDGEAWATAARVSMETIRRRYDITSGREALARSQVERAIRLAPASVEAGLAMAAHLAEKGNSASVAFFSKRSFSADEEVERRLRDLNVRAPQDARVLLMLARVLNYASVRKDPEATEIRLHHPVFAGRDPRPLVDEADVLHVRGRFAEAEALVDRAQALAPTLDGYYTKLVLMTRYVRDAAATRRFIETLPTQVLLEDAFASRVAWFHIRQGAGVIALSHLRRVPRDFFEEKQQVLPKGFQTGWAQRINGRLTAAESEWKQALSVVDKRILVEPNQAELVSLKALLLALTDQRDEAEKVWKLAGELVGRPAGQEGFTTAEFHLALGRNEDAIRALQSVRRFQISNRTLENRSSLLYDPWWEPIRNDPAVQKLIREVEELYQQLWQSDGKPAAKSASSSAPSDESKSVAVLAFANRSDDKGSEYFSDGISDELINVLGKTPGLKVSARTSAFHFKGKDTPIPEIAKQLGVAYVVEGSVRKAGNRVRITAQLIKAADGFHVWSDNFERDLEDIFAVQDEIAGLIAKNLSLKLGATTSTGPINPEVFRLYLEGRQEWSKRSPEGFAKAQALFEQAIKLDPKFARAHAGLADVWAQRRRLTEDSASADEALAQARRLLDKALELDSSLAEAHASRALYFGAELGEESVEAGLRRALALNPSYATGHQWLGLHLARQGKIEAGIAELKLATQLDPLSPVIASAHGFTLGKGQRWTEALTAADRALVLEPGMKFALVDRGAALLGLNRRQGALTPLRAAMEKVAAPDARLLAHLAHAGDRVTAEKYASAIFANPQTNRSHEVFKLYIALNRIDEGFAYVAREKNRPLRFPGELTDPIFDAVRADPRFVRALEEAGVLAQYRRMQVEILAWKTKNQPP